MTRATPIRGDALHLPLRDSSVDMIVTSPPYFALRAYQDGGQAYDGQVGGEATPSDFLAALWAVTAEAQRVLKPTGSMFANLGDKMAGSGGHNDSNIAGPTQASDGILAKSLMGLPWRYANGCIDGMAGDRWILRAEIVWDKPNGMPESATDRVRRSHEQWFHLVKQGWYYQACDDLRVPYMAEERDDAAPGPPGGNRMPDRVGTVQLGNLAHGSTLGRLPGSVWNIPTEPLRVPDDLGVDHFAAFPQEWPRRLITGWCPLAVCAACGDGRAPVVERHTTGVDNNARAKAMGHNIVGKTFTDTRAAMAIKAEHPDKIIGYGCQCGTWPTPLDTSAPASTPGVVLDIFGGSGTTAGVARQLGRTGITIDLSADYCRLANWRINWSGHFSKSFDRMNAENQGTLFGAA